MIEIVNIIFEWISIIACIIALIIIMLNKRKIFDLNIIVALIILFILLLFHNISNYLEIINLSPTLTLYRDLFQLLEPLTWGFIIYAHLLNNKVEVVKKQAKIIEEKKTFNELLFDIISHDLGNYNQIIQGNSELLKRIIVDDETALICAQRIKNAISNSNMLIYNVRMLNRLHEKGIKEEYEQIKVMLNSAIQQIREIYQNVIIDVSIDEFEEKENEPILGFRALEIVFLNIIGNAVKHRKVDQKVITIDIKLVHEDHKLLLSFIDNSSGIIDELKQIIFNRYDGTRNIKSGTGIGLLISKRIVDMIGGEIWVENRLDNQHDHTKGTTFNLRVDVRYSLEEFEPY